LNELIILVIPRLATEINLVITKEQEQYLAKYWQEPGRIQPGFLEYQT